ncbi:MAG: hypothetical protein JSV88_22885, partial [Candidatus Aminicenantes bacterium]
ANTRNRKQMTMGDLEHILKERIYVSQNGVTDVFWQQFCQAEIMKTTVLQIATGEMPGDKKSVFRLEQHGFLVKGKEGVYRMRVPIFEEWVKRFGELV